MLLEVVNIVIFYYVISFYDLIDFNIHLDSFCHWKK